MDELRYEYCPPDTGSQIDHVGTYKRHLPVSLERMYENTLDWEHLPHLHNSSFTELEVLEAGSWGWRAKVCDNRGRESLLQLSLDRSCPRWITRNIEGPSKGAEIWTHVFVTAPHAMDIVIDFYVPGVPVESREKVGRAYARAYETLYDEDVAMMTERQRRLDERLDAVRDGHTLQVAKPEPSVMPLAVVFGGRPFLVSQHKSEWVIYPAACPHQLGPLSGVNEAGIVRCPWHGYEFDVRTGACRTGQPCKLPTPPTLQLRDGRWWLEPGAAAAGGI